MFYYVNYGVNGCGENEQIVDAKNKEEAIEWAYEAAIEEYHSYEGYHGVMGMSEVAEDMGLNLENDKDIFAIEEVYWELIENEIFYYAEEYNEKYTDVLEEFGVFKI